MAENVVDSFGLYRDVRNVICSYFGFVERAKIRQAGQCLALWIESIEDIECDAIHRRLVSKGVNVKALDAALVASGTSLTGVFVLCALTPTIEPKETTLDMQLELDFSTGMTNEVLKTQRERTRCIVEDYMKDTTVTMEQELSSEKLQAFQALHVRYTNPIPRIDLQRFSCVQVSIVLPGRESRTTWEHIPCPLTQVRYTANRVVYSEETAFCMDSRTSYSHQKDDVELSKLGFLMLPRERKVVVRQSAMYGGLYVYAIAGLTAEKMIERAESAFADDPPETAQCLHNLASEYIKVAGTDHPWHWPVNLRTLSPLRIALERRIGWWFRNRRADICRYCDKTDTRIESLFDSLFKGDFLFMCPSCQFRTRHACIQ